MAGTGGHRGLFPPDSFAGYFRWRAARRYSLLRRLRECDGGLAATGHRFDGLVCRWRSPSELLYVSLPGGSMLTATEHQRFEEQGFLPLRQVMSDEQLAELQDRLDDLTQGRLENGVVS